MMPLQCATLERLSLEEMITKSTAIVRGKVTDSWAAFSGPAIYTHYTIQVAERFKGTGGNSVDVVVPGGVANNLRQVFPGAPALSHGEEYVFFLWTSRAGLTQVIGLTQGLFSLPAGAAPDPVATRSASQELMLDRQTGRPVKDQTLTMRLSELRARIASTLGNGQASAK
jgi:hypothetical protein